ncbi:hypothetical protein Q5O14_10965 [Eubacteriaceae bacterium ES2]|nr:hypothetical protein Q5O14_10965 [Eubacteriaceae bacterium ES2]
MKKNLILAGSLALVLMTGGTAMAHGHGSYDGSGSGYHSGYQSSYCDYNSDGVCDGSYVDADGDGLCDNCDGTQSHSGSGSMHRGRHR